MKDIIKRKEVRNLLKSLTIELLFKLLIKLNQYIFIQQLFFFSINILQNTNEFQNYKSSINYFL